ncbi:MAG TPA: GTP cyclohydrolase I FolE [Actinopolymorphaceae bacterium]
MVDVEKAAGAIAELLIALGVQDDENTRDTPRRVAEAWQEALVGYEEDPRVHLSQKFSGPSEPGLVMISRIRVVSTCAHHLLPIVGMATVAYRPQSGDKVVGLSKLVRLVKGYSRRLQLQEHLGYEISTAIQQSLNPIGSACIISARHECMTWRGIEEDSTTTTQALAGGWRAGDPDVQTVLEEHYRSARGA